MRVRESLTGRIFFTAVACLILMAGLQILGPGMPDPVYAAGTITTIHFDSYSDGTNIKEQYASQGLHFLNDYTSGLYRSNPQITAHTYARTAPNVLVNDYYDDEFHSSKNIPMVIWFDQPVAGIGMWLGTMETNQFTCSGS